jgi:hypothetical protein
LLGRIPGMQQLSALKQMKGGAEGGMFDEMMDGGNQFAGMSKNQLSRHASQLKRAGQPVPPDLRAALRSASGGGGSTTADHAALLARKQERKKKQKQAKISRKKGRKR